MMPLRMVEPWFTSQVELPAHWALSLYFAYAQTTGHQTSRAASIITNILAHNGRFLASLGPAACVSHLHYSTL
eukprot:6173434-Pleurochrysis_carterae.AAC.2